VAASRAAARQHCPSVLGFHAGAETVRLRAPTIVWLKGTFRHLISNIQYSAAGGLRARILSRFAPGAPVPCANDVAFGQTGFLADRGSIGGRGSFSAPNIRV